MSPSPTRLPVTSRFSLSRLSISGDMRDRIGIGFSSLCLVHCLLMPFVLTAFPAFTLGVSTFFPIFFSDDHGLETAAAHSASSHMTFHAVMGLLVAASAGFSFIPAYRKHLKGKVLAAAAAGLSLVLFGILVCAPAGGDWSRWETPLTVAGSLILVWAHWQNRKALHPFKHINNLSPLSSRSSPNSNGEPEHVHGPHCRH